MKSGIFRACLIIICVGLSGCSNKKANNTDDKAASLLNIKEYVKTANNVSTDMLRADYWIERQENIDNVIMTFENICQWNKEYQIDLDANGVSFWGYDEEDEISTIKKDHLRTLIMNSFSKPEQPVYDGQGNRITKEFWDGLYQKTNMDRIEDNNKIHYGVTVERADIRALPHEGIITDNKDNNFICQLQVSSILMNEPVIVVHESTDGNWYYVLTTFCHGWIKSDNVALCVDYSQWEKILHSKDFLLVTGDRVQTEMSATAEITLYMGTKLELIKQEEYATNGEERIPYESYIVKYPIKTEKGLLDYKLTYIPYSRDVNVGHLEFNVRNLIKQMFKVNGNRYGWGGMYHARDCSQYVMELYRCFGFNLPRNSKAQSEVPMNNINFEGKSEKDKMRMLKDIPIGSILYFPGHVMLYLGEVDGNYYVISPVARLIQADSDKVENVHTCMVTSLKTKRPNGNSWMEEITTIVSFGK